jgi:quercetin dioxygenase-like cupin family protein
VSKTEPANVLIFQAGDTGQRVPAIKLLMELPFQKTAHQQVSLQRLTLPAGALFDASAHSGPGIVYVLEGKIEASGPAGQSRPYGAGELLVEPAYGAGLTFNNTSSSEPAKLLLYSLSEGGKEQCEVNPWSETRS